eukprot:TRINITY_DN2551_c0_g1_i1.p1 TRINITY_DN2551_c0_g1~~TRINITY_DN2551_c0_g1_i1.p1  ORF type:complete len:310 (-),score=44.16 TRINITY_DN2551_c0_g1_i1:109-1038(-)
MKFKLFTKEFNLSGWDFLKLFIITVLILVIITLVTLFFIPNSPIQDVVLNFFEWLQSVPTYYSALIMFAVQTTAVVIVLPGTPFNMACGFLFGIWVGSVVSVLSTDLACIIGFLIGRYLARDWAAEQIEQRPKFKAIDQAVDRYGWYIIFLIRISPVFPFGVCNYLFGITKVPFYKYWLASTAGLAPYTIAYTYIGSLTRDLADIFSDDAEESDSWIWLTVGGVSTLLSVVFIAWVTRRALQKAIDEIEKEEIEKGNANSSGMDEGKVASVVVDGYEDDEEAVVTRSSQSKIKKNLNESSPVRDSKGDT